LLLRRTERTLAAFLHGVGGTVLSVLNGILGPKFKSETEERKMKKTLLWLTLALALAISAAAQNDEHGTGWGSILTQSNLPAATGQPTDTCAAPITGNSYNAPIVGSWLIKVRSSLDHFMTMQTFNFGGTMTEKASGPDEIAGHGVWVSTGPDSAGVTFEVFNNDKDGKRTGQARIRGSYRVDKQDHLIASGVVIDFIDTHNNVYCNVATGTLKGTRITVLAP
jgi:hypothetical protein